jgi:hypothetical protein
MNMPPEPRVNSVERADNLVRDQRRWGLTALLLIIAGGALARQAASRRR